MATATMLHGGGIPRRPHAGPHSTRLPWTRAGLSTLVIGLLPFTWVLQLDGCTETVEARATGVDLLETLHFSPAYALLAAALLVLALVAPRLAALARRTTAREGVHLAGLVATAVVVVRGVGVVLGTTEVRTVQPAGALVLVALGLAFVDAIARVMLGGVELADGPEARPPAPG